MSDMKDILTLGNAIKFLRTKKSLSSRALSSICGLSPSYIGKVEAGIIQPSFDAFCAIVQALKVNDTEVLFLIRLNQRKLNEAQPERPQNVDVMSASGPV